MKFLAAVLAALVAWFLFRSRVIGNGAVAIRNDDPLMLAATHKARNSLAILRSLWPTENELALKFPLRNAAGEIEHVWCKPTEIGETAVLGVILTPLLRGPTPDGPQSFALDSIEDWQMFEPDGRIRGGFTTQAQIAICERDRISIPAPLAAQKGRFVEEAMS